MSQFDAVQNQEAANANPVPAYPVTAPSAVKKLPIQAAWQITKDDTKIWKWRRDDSLSAMRPDDKDSRWVLVAGWATRGEEQKIKELSWDVRLKMSETETPEDVKNTTVDELVRKLCKDLKFVQVGPKRLPERVNASQNIIALTAKRTGLKLH